MNDHIKEIRITKFPNGKYQYDLYGYAFYLSFNKLVLLSCVDTMYETRDDALNAAREHSLVDGYNIDKDLKITDYMRVSDNNIYSVPVSKDNYLIWYLIVIFIIIVYLIYQIY